MELFTQQFFLGITAGAVCLGICLIIFKPLADEWAKNRIKALQDENESLTTKVNTLVIGDEQIFGYWMKGQNELKAAQDRVHWLEGQNDDLGSTIIVLSNEKSALQDLRNKHYIERDMLKTRISKLTSPGYRKSKTVQTIKVR